MADNSENLINVVDPDTQQLGSIPAHQLQEALDQGFTQATPEALAAARSSEKYGTLPQKALTALEGLGVGGTFGLSTALETGIAKGLGYKPEEVKEDIRGRREENPWTHMGGEGLSLLIPGAPEAKLLSEAGEGARALTGLGGEGAGLLSKMGGSAAKNAVETMMVQGGDEVSKALASDPHSSAETALTDIGLAGLFGGAMGAGFGVVSPLWNAALGTKTGQILKAITQRASGIDGEVPSAMKEVLEHSGMELKPEIKQALTADPELEEISRNLASHLSQSDTTAAGRSFQESQHEFVKQAGESLVKGMGRTPEQLDSLSDLSANEIGKGVQESLSKEFQAQVEPASKLYNQLQEKYRAVEIPTPMINSLAEKISQAAIDKGWNLVDSAEAGLTQRILKGLPNIKTLQDLKLAQSNIGKTANREQLWDAGKTLKNLFQDVRTQLVQERLTAEAPELLGAHEQANALYREAMNSAEELNRRLHVGKYSGPESFVANLNDMKPEEVLRRLSGKADANLLSFLQEKFPGTAQSIKDFQINDLLKKAQAKAAPGQTINAGALLKAVNEMSPEMRSFVLPEQSLKRIESVGTLLEKMKDPTHNFSNTARTWDKLSEYIPGSVLSMISLLTGHSPVASLLIAPLTKYLAKDVPDAVRLGLLKLLGSTQPIESEGFKTMVDFIHHAMKGESLVNKATKGIFKAGSEVLPQALVPTPKETEKLDKQLKELQKNPDPLFQIGGKTAHYLPDHGTALATIGARANSYLNAQRPMPVKRNPLDKEVEPSDIQKAQFHRTLQIAQQPLMVLKHIKEGTLQPSDLVTLKTLNPSLYTKLVSKMTDQMLHMKPNEDSIPYHTRMSLSLFMGQPMDSTMTPQAIQAAQPKMPQQAPEQPTPSKHSMSGLSKMPSLNFTSLQGRESQKASKF